MSVIFKTQEVHLCDHCRKEGYVTPCLKCGQELCYDCQKFFGKEYPHGVSFGGTGDGFYCNSCDRRLTAEGTDPLHNAYVAIQNLRQESQDYYADFSKRSKEAELHLKELLYTE